MTNPSLSLYLSLSDIFVGSKDLPLPFFFIPRFWVHCRRFEAIEGVKKSRGRFRCACSPFSSPALLPTSGQAAGKCVCSRHATHHSKRQPDTKHCPTLDQGNTWHALAENCPSISWSQFPSPNILSHQTYHIISYHTVSAFFLPSLVSFHLSLSLSLSVLAHVLVKKKLSTTHNCFTSLMWIIHQIVHGLKFPRLLKTTCGVSIKPVHSNFKKTCFWS